MNSTLAAAEGTRSSDIEILLDPADAALRREQRTRRHNVQTVPALRWIGLTLFVLLLPLHDYYLINSFSPTRSLLYGLAVEAYCALSFVCLRKFYGHTGKVELGVAFLSLDVLVMTVGIYLSGAERNLWYWVLLLRVADQAPTNFRRVAYFAALTVACFAGMLLFADYIGGHQFSWPQQSAHLLLFSSAAFYIALTSRAAEALHRRVSSAIRVSRDLIRQLEGKTQQLEENSRQLDDARVAAEQGNRAKTEFLSRVSHELRTPMNHILGFAQLLEMDSLNGEQRESVQHILTGGRHLLGMIDEVLDISSLEAGELHLALGPVHVRDALRAVLSIVHTEARQREITITTEGFHDKLAPVLADPVRLRQVLLNLIVNAVRYNVPGGTVAVSVAQSSQELRIAVRDTGPGVRPDHVDRLFTPFDRLGAEQTGVAGTGLGLPVSRALVHAMGGEMGVVSEQGAGADFWFTLPVAHAETEP